MVQVQEAWDHGYDMIEPDVGGVVEELKRLDPSLGVRLGTRHHERAWVIFRKHCAVHPDFQTECWDCQQGLERTFVTSRKAVQNSFGTWEGLTHEIVDRLRLVSSEGYNFAEEVERQNRQAEQAAEKNRIEKLSEHGEELAHAIRKDLGVRYKGRAFT